MKFHRDCAAKAAPSCGLPKEYVDLFLDRLKEGNSCEFALFWAAGWGYQIGNDFIKKKHIYTYVSSRVFNLGISCLLRDRPWSLCKCLKREYMSHITDMNAALLDF